MCLCEFELQPVQGNFLFYCLHANATSSSPECRLPARNQSGVKDAWGFLTCLCYKHKSCSNFRFYMFDCKDINFRFWFSQREKSPAAALQQLGFFSTGSFVSPSDQRWFFYSRIIFSEYLNSCINKVLKSLCCLDSACRLEIYRHIFQVWSKLKLHESFTIRKFGFNPETESTSWIFDSGDVELLVNLLPEAVMSSLDMGTPAALTEQEAEGRGFIADRKRSDFFFPRQETESSWELLFVEKVGNRFTPLWNPNRSDLFDSQTLKKCKH